MSPRVTIVVPVYNAEPFLAEALESVRAQTFTDWECLCVDDGSADGSPKTLATFVAKDPRFRVVRKVNQGLSLARATGTDHAQGASITYLDADDLLHPRALEWMLAAQEATDVDVVWGDFTRFTDAWAPEEATLPELHPVRDADYRKLLATLFLADGFTVMTCNKLFRTNAVRALGFPVYRGAGEDNLFAARFFPKQRSAVHLSLPTYGYRLRSGSISQTHTLRWATENFVVTGEVLSAWRSELPDIFPDFLKSFANSTLYAGLFRQCMRAFVETGAIKDPQVAHTLRTAFATLLSPDLLAACTPKVHRRYLALAHGHWRYLRFLFTNSSLDKKSRNWPD